MNPPPPPPPSSSSSQPPHLSLSRYGPASTQAFPEGAAMRSFLPAGGNPPPPDHTASAGPYGGGGDISLGHQLDGEEERDAGAAARSPAVFFSNLMMDVGFSGSKAAAGSSSTEAHPTIPNSNRNMKSHLLGATLSHISEDGFTDLLRRGDHPVDEASNGHAAMARSFSGGFSIRPWDDSNTVAFALPPSSSAGRRSKDSNGDIIAALSSYDQTQFSMAGTSLEMAGVEKYLVQMQQEQVPFKVRAKRGCATHPRSIAERERRTRISEKLRKLQDLVPNMDKQTSTADMLDLAVGHIKGLQTQLQALKQEQERCTCCSKQARN